MHIQIAIRVLGILMMLFSITMIPPIIVSLIYQDGIEIIFLRALGTLPAERVLKRESFVAWSEPICLMSSSSSKP